MGERGHILRDAMCVTSSKSHVICDDRGRVGAAVRGVGERVRARGPEEALHGDGHALGCG